MTDKDKELVAKARRAHSWEEFDKLMSQAETPAARAAIDYCQLHWYRSEEHQQEIMNDSYNL